jgi:hypothetical protein
MVLMYSWVLLTLEFQICFAIDSLLESKHFASNLTLGDFGVDVHTEC